MFWGICALIAVIFAALVMVYFHNQEAIKIVDEDEIVYVDTIEAQAPLTIYDVLCSREQEREKHHMDSTYMTMPIPILVAILKTHGTSLSRYDVVYIYESNKEYYDAVEKGAIIQKDVSLLTDSVKNHYVFEDTLKRQSLMVNEYFNFNTNWSVKIGQSSVNDKPVGRKQLSSNRIVSAMSITQKLIATIVQTLKSGE